MTPFDPDQVMALYQLSKLVRASLDTDATLAAIVHAACELTGAEQSAILLLDEHEHLVLRVGLGAVAAAVGEHVPASSGIAGRALRARRPVLVGDMLIETDRARPDLDARSGIRGYIAAPLVWNAQTVGVLTVGATTQNAFGTNDTALVLELAEHAAAAVAHARMYADEQARRAHTEALNGQLAERTEQLQRLQVQLVQTEKLTALGQLAQGIAHELNTPLGVIVSNLAVLQQYGTSLAEFARRVRAVASEAQRDPDTAAAAETLTDAAQSADLNYILEDLPLLTSESTASADRIAAIVRSVATFARQSPQALASVDMEEALEAAVTLAWNDLKHRGPLVKNFAGVPPVIGHLSELAQVFVHLLLNAAQALEGRQGTITLTTARDSDSASVVIRDDGCGVPSEHLPRVFDPFFSTRGPGQGTGMGLAVCHGVVTRFGGTIELESEFEQGTTVTVRLPLAELSPQEPG